MCPLRAAQCNSRQGHRARTRPVKRMSFFLRWIAECLRFRTWLLRSILRSRGPNNYGLTSLCLNDTFLCMPRTTLMLEDSLFRQLKKKAAEEGRTLQAVANDALRRGLATPLSKWGFKLKMQGWKATELPGVDILDRDKLFDLMNGR